MVTKPTVTALMLCGLAQTWSPLSAQQLPPNQAIPGQAAPLTSKDYLQLMEQANLAAGIQPSGGNFPGAKPRPRGSIEATALPPASIPHQASSQLPTQQLPTQQLPTQQLPTQQLPTQQLPTQQLPTQQLPTQYFPAQSTTSLQSPAPQTPVWFPPAPSHPANPVPTANPASQAPNLTIGPTPADAQVNQPTSAQVLSTKPWTGPRWIGRYGAVGMRRPGDESLSYSHAGELGTFGSDLASEIAVGYLTNPIDCYEFTYLGSLRWNRELDSIGPVNSPLSSSDSQWIAPFQNADSHHQTHSAGLRQYGLNRRWLTDDIGNSTLGLRVIDYSERYRMESTKGAQRGLYALDSGNLLVGLTSGMELWRPVSQRVAFGGAIDGGLYANFADASIQANDGNSRYSTVEDQDLSLAASLGVHLRGRYQLQSWAGLYGGYRWMVVSGLSTVDDQAPPPLSDNMLLSTSSDATILFHGFDAGLELRF